MLHPHSLKSKRRIQSGSRNLSLQLNKNRAVIRSHSRKVNNFGFGESYSPITITEAPVQPFFDSTIGPSEVSTLKSKINHGIILYPGAKTAKLSGIRASILIGISGDFIEISQDKPRQIVSRMDYVILKALLSI